MTHKKKLLRNSLILKACVFIMIYQSIQTLNRVFTVIKIPSYPYRCWHTHYAEIHVLKTNNDCIMSTPFSLFLGKMPQIKRKMVLQNQPHIYLLLVCMMIIHLSIIPHKQTLQFTVHFQPIYNINLTSIKVCYQRISIIVL